MKFLCAGCKKIFESTVDQSKHAQIKCPTCTARSQARKQQQIQL